MLSLVLLFAAVACFALAALGFDGRLTNVGLACFAGSFLA